MQTEVLQVVQSYICTASNIVCTIICTASDANRSITGSTVICVLIVSSGDRSSVCTVSMQTEVLQVVQSYVQHLIQAGSITSTVGVVIYAGQKFMLIC